MAHRQFYTDLIQIGVPDDIICEKEYEILDILKAQGMVAGNHISGSNARDQNQSQLLGGGCSHAELFHMSSY